VSMYRVEYLQVARFDVLDAEAYLYEHSPSAAAKFVDAIGKQETLLIDHPLMYPAHEGNNYFRRMMLPYEYICFYHVDEKVGLITVHRILRGMRDVASIL